MPAQTLAKRPPGKILLATDLSPRGDRALDRAAQLARQWDAELLIVHAMAPRPASMTEYTGPLPSWRRPPMPGPAIERRIRRDLRETVSRLTIHLEKGEAGQVILDTAEREECDLIILGTPQDEMLDRMLFGSTVEHLVRKSPVSLLVVKTRPNGPYGQVLVGTDFTEESRYGLEVASAAFPDSALTVMHAFDMPYRSLMSDNALSHGFAEMERATIQEFVQEADLTHQARARIRTIIEHGPPEVMLSQYVEEKHADLTVIGAYGHGRLFHLLIRGNTPRIIDSVPSDILLVRAHREGTVPSSGT